MLAVRLASTLALMPRPRPPESTAMTRRGRARGRMYRESLRRRLPAGTGGREADGGGFPRGSLGAILESLLPYRENSIERDFSSSFQQGCRADVKVRNVELRHRL